jgi:CoA-transferase family III
VIEAEAEQGRGYIVSASSPLREPLAGITVIDLSHVYNGPYATFLMAMAGARVIKVEPLDGEHLRSRGAIGGALLPFAMLNSNKEPVTLNGTGALAAARDGRSRRCAGRELRSRCHGSPRAWGKRSASSQSAPDLRLQLRLWQGWSVS